MPRENLSRLTRTPWAGNIATTRANMRERPTVPIGFFITHPEVVVDPALPVPRWHLSETGVRRMRTFSASPLLRDVRAIHCSDETKAEEAALILASNLGLEVTTHEGLRENDRSATGFLPPTEFEAMADAFFARPDESVRGWERAADAQRRVMAATDAVLSSHGGGDLAIVAHGAVGTLLLCSYLAIPISRDADQPSQGHYWSFDIETRSVRHRWLPLEAA
jgi:broad specificity phosphatase PhoE